MCLRNKDEQEKNCPLLWAKPSSHLRCFLEIYTLGNRKFHKNILHQMCREKQENIEHVALSKTLWSRKIRDWVYIGNVANLEGFLPIGYKHDLQHKQYVRTVHTICVPHRDLLERAGHYLLVSWILCIIESGNIQE